MIATRARQVERRFDVSQGGLWRQGQLLLDG